MEPKSMSLFCEYFALEPAPEATVDRTIANISFGLLYPLRVGNRERGMGNGEWGWSAFLSRQVIHPGVVRSMREMLADIISGRSRISSRPERHRERTFERGDFTKTDVRYVSLRVAMKYSRLVLLCSSFALVTPATFAQTQPIDEQVSEVVSYLVGAMDSSAQAIAHRDAPDVRITTCSIAVPTISAAFLYQEQALSMHLGNPYRQRFLQIAPNDNEDAVESKAFKLANPEAWIGLCDRPASDRVITIAELGETVCSLFLKRSGNGYRGITPEEGCPTNFRGAVRITNTVFLAATTMETWDRGFDAAGNQVWGASDRSYQYSDIDPDTHDPEANAIARMLNGKFDNAAQASADESFLPVRQNNCPVTISNSPFPENTPVLVSEQASNAPTLQFASQRLVQIRRSGSQLEMASYKLNGEGFADFCDRPEAERVLSADQIGDPECSIFFEREGDEFVGSTPPGGCPSNFRGSQYLTIDARFSSERLEIWERWYDAEGNQVAGSETGTYVYVAQEM